MIYPYASCCYLVGNVDRTSKHEFGLDFHPSLFGQAEEDASGVFQGLLAI